MIGVHLGYNLRYISKVCLPNTLNKRPKTLNKKPKRTEHGIGAGEEAECCWEAAVRDWAVVESDILYMLRIETR